MREEYGGGLVEHVREDTVFPHEHLDTDALLCGLYPDMVLSVSRFDDVALSRLSLLSILVLGRRLVHQYVLVNHVFWSVLMKTRTFGSLYKRVFRTWLKMIVMYYNYRSSVHTPAVHLER